MIQAEARLFLEERIALQAEGVHLSVDERLTLNVFSPLAEAELVAALHLLATDR